MLDEEIADLRNRMVDEQIAGRGIHDPAVLAALREVPREAFVPDYLRSDAYEDSPLPIGAGQTISQPYIVALMLEAARIGPGDRVLEVGAGSGYATAVASRIAARVYAIERVDSLCEEARARLATLGHADTVELRCGDGSAGWPEAAPFDAIIVSAGAPAVPEALKSQLADGGRLVLPIGADAHSQHLVCITRRGCDPLRPGDVVRGALRAADRRAGLARPRGLRAAGRLTRRAPEERKSSRAGPSGLGADDPGSTVRSRHERKRRHHASNAPNRGPAGLQRRRPRPGPDAVQRPGRRAGQVALEADHLHRALPGRRHDRRAGAPDRPEARPGPRHDDRRRQQGRRRRQRRLRDGVACRAGRLHDPRRHDQLARDQRQPVPEDRLRPGRVVHADHADRHQPDRPRRQPGEPVQDAAGRDRGRQGEEAADLGVGRQRHLAAPVARAAEGEGRHRHHAHPVQGQRARRSRT